MIFSRQSLVSNAQAITATAFSTDAIDLGAIGFPYGNKQALRRDVGKGMDIPFLVQAVETFNNLTSLTIDIVTSDDPTLATAPVVHGTSGAIPLANLKAGWQFPYTVIPNAGDPAVPMKRYLGVRYTVAGTAPTLGRVTAGVTMGVQTNG